MLYLFLITIRHLPQKIKRNWGNHGYYWVLSVTTALFVFLLILVWTSLFLLLFLFCFLLCCYCFGFCTVSLRLFGLGVVGAVISLIYGLLVVASFHLLVALDLVFSFAFWRYSRWRKVHWFNVAFGTL